MENPIKMDDLGVPLFSETSIYPFNRDLNRHFSRCMIFVLGDFLLSTMVNHHSPSFGRIYFSFSKHLQQIQVIKPLPLVN